MKHFRRKSIITAMALAIPSFMPTLTHAQESYILEEIVITAQKREENLQDVPVSVSAFGGEQIAEGGMNDLEALSAHVPNLHITQGPSVSKISIRGLGSGDNQGFEQSVGLFIDGVYAGRARQFQAPFLDVAGVEVLRGPQGTLFGKNTIAGAMTVTTAQPTDELEAYLRTSYDSKYKNYTVDGVISGPITDNLMGRFAVRQAESDGYLENTSLDSEEVSSVNTVLRGSLLWKPNDDLDVLAKYEQGRSDNVGRSYRMKEVGAWGPFLQAADPDFEVDSDKRSTSEKEYADTDSESFTLNVNYALGDLEITSITGYSEYQNDDLLDADTSPIEASFLLQNQEFDQWSQELRLTSPLGGEFDYIAGVYYQTSSLKAQRGLGIIPANIAGGPGVNPAFAFLPPIGFSGNFDQDTETYAAFGSLGWHPRDDLHLTFGLRYTVEEKEAKRDLSYTGYDTNVSLAQTYDPVTDALAYGSAVAALQGVGFFEHEIEGDRRAENVSPSLKISYDLNQDVMLYASISQAFKSGGFNEAGGKGDDVGEYAATGSAEVFDFDEEEALAFEVGAKTTLLDGRATLNLALFRTNYSDLQVSSFQGDGYIVGNAAEAISQGLEVDGSVRLKENLTLTGSFSYLDAHYSKFENATCTVGQVAASADPTTCTQDLTDRELPNAPEWSGTIALDHETTFSENLMLRSHLDVAFTDEQYLGGDLDENTLEDSHTTLNARVALSNLDGKWELALVGKNLTDEEIVTFSNDPFLLGGTFFAYMAPPRTLEVQFNLAY
jgi:iron complex outermembrane recepter protein